MSDDLIDRLRYLARFVVGMHGFEDVCRVGPGKTPPTRSKSCARMRRVRNVPVWCQLGAGKAKSDVEELTKALANIEQAQRIIWSFETTASMSIGRLSSNPVGLSRIKP